MAAAAYAMLIGGAEVIAHFLAAGFAAADFFFAIATEGWKSWRYEKAGRGRELAAAGCARATAALPHAAAREVRFPGHSKHEPLLPQARRGQRSGRRYRHVLARTWRPLPMLCSLEAVKR